jgi:hypothetical protein
MALHDGKSIGGDSTIGHVAPAFGHRWRGRAVTRDTDTVARIV